MTSPSISNRVERVLRSLTGASSDARRARRAKARPSLEFLEDRMLLASPPVYNGGTGFWSAPVSGWETPLLVRESYGFPNLEAITVNGKTYQPDGSGQTIGIIGEGHESNLAASVQVFDTQTIENQSQIPPLDGKNGDGSLKQVAMNGGTSTLGEPLENGSFETDLDVEWAHAMAPKANIVVVEVPFDPSGNTNYDDLKTAAATAVRLKASVISMSFSGFGSAQPPFSFAGVTIISTSGDKGAFSIPAGSSSSLVVGGTEGKDGQTVVWNDNYTGDAPLGGSTADDTPQGTRESTGGGIYPAGFPLPSWQVSAAGSYGNNPGNVTPTARMEPDVSALAANMATVDITDGKSLGGASNRLATPWVNGDGTSYGAPIWAGIIAVVNQERALLVPSRGPLNGIDPTLPMLYGLSDDFFDITQGWVNKGLGGERDAYPGYDLDTGLGDPLVDDLIPDLVQPFTGYFSQVEGNTLVIATNQNGGTDNLSIGIEQLRDGPYLEVTDNKNVTDEFPIGSFTTIAIYARNATDNIKVYETPAGVTTTIGLDGGNDTVTLSPDAHTLSDIGGAVTVFGGSGTTRLDAYDSRDVTANNNYWLTSNSLGGTTFPTISFSGVHSTNIYGGSNLGSTTISYHIGVNRDGSIAHPSAPTNPFIYVYMNGDGKSTENADVESTSTGSLLTINLGGGTDTVTVSPKAQLLTNVAGSVDVVGNGTGGSDTLNIDDQSNQIDSTYHISSQSVTRSNWGGGVQWSAIHAVNLRGGKGAGGDGTETYEIGNIMPGLGAGPAWSFNLFTTGTGTGIVNVQNTPAAMGLTLNLPTKDNTVSITPKSEQWSQVDGTVSIVATGSTSTRLNIDDQKDTSSINYFVTSHSAGIDFGLPIGFVGVTQLYLNGGPGSKSGGETYHIGTASSGPTPLRIGPIGNVYLAVTALGVMPELISVVDEFYTAFNAAHFSLEGFAGISVSGTKNDSVLVENNAPQSPPSGFTAAPQTFTVTPTAVNVFYSESQTTGTARSNNAATLSVGYSGVGWVGVVGGQAGEQFLVGDGKNNLDVLYPTVSIQGQAGDPLTINDAPAPSPIFTKEAPDFKIDSSKVTWVNPVTANVFGASKSVTLTGEIDYSGVTTIELDGGPVASTFNVSSTPAGSTFTLLTNSAATSKVNILGNSGTVTVNTHGAGDVVNAGSGTNTLDSIFGTVNVNRAAGTDTLNVNDQGEATAELYEIEPGVIERGLLNWQGPFIPAQTINYSGVTSVFVNGGTATDLYGVGGSPAGTSLSVNAGPVYNEWIVADTADNLDDIQGRLTLHSASGEDLLEDYDYLNSAPHRYAVNGETVTRDGIQPIVASGFGEVVLSTGSVGGSTVNVTSTSAQTAWTVVVASSGDTVTVGAAVAGGTHTMQSIQSQLSIESVANSTPKVILDDSGHLASAGLSRTVTFSQDPTYGDIVINGLAPAQIDLPIGAGGNVSVKGDAGNDTFAIDAVPQGWNLGLDGQGGTDTLDYSGYTGDVTVNLREGTATGLSGIQNIRNVTGSNGNSLIVGDANANVLKGGSGRSILIGGAGVDQLTGGAGDNILIGGTTAYDITDLALEALKTEWDRTDIGFGARVHDLTIGVVSSGVKYSLTSATVHADQAADALAGGGENWFFDATKDPDSLTGEKGGDMITYL